MLMSVNRPAAVEKRRIANIGEKHWNWQGGKTSEIRKLRNSAAYKHWRDSVFKRDNFTCVLCGARSGKGKKVFLNADHIKTFAKFPDLRLDISNGRTLCLPCHKKTENFGNKKTGGVHN